VQSMRLRGVQRIGVAINEGRQHGVVRVDECPHAVRRRGCRHPAIVSVRWTGRDRRVADFPDSSVEVRAGDRDASEVGPVVAR
jgi:hypothetical protein